MTKKEIREFIKKIRKDADKYLEGRTGISIHSFIDYLEEKYGGTKT